MLYFRNLDKPSKICYRKSAFIANAFDLPQYLAISSSLLPCLRSCLCKRQACHKIPVGVARLDRRKARPI